MTKKNYIIEAFQSIKSLSYQKTALEEEIKEVYKIAKDNGVDIKILKKAISELSKDPDQREKEEDILHEYISIITSE